jgi:hypothetical protein
MIDRDLQEQIKTKVLKTLKRLDRDETLSREDVIVSTQEPITRDESNYIWIYSEELENIAGLSGCIGVHMTSRDEKESIAEHLGYVKYCVANYFLSKEQEPLADLETCTWGI